MITHKACIATVLLSKVFTYGRSIKIVSHFVNKYVIGFSEFWKITKTGFKLSAAKSGVVYINGNPRNTSITINVQAKVEHILKLLWNF